jgi:predicted deacylase
LFSRFYFVLAIILVLVFPVLASASPPWSKLVVLAGAQPGPVLMVITGVHGDEVSGPLAASKLAAGPAPARGTLVILPVASPEALAAGQRWLPGWSDLNRAFPDADEFCAYGSTLSARSAYAASDPTYLRADEILALIVSVSPDLVLDLHESDQYWTEGDGPALVVPAPAGSAKSARSAELALGLLESPDLAGFGFTGPPPDGSLVAAVDGLLGIPSVLVEAPDALAVDSRIAVHLSVVSAAMGILGMDDLEPGVVGTGTGVLESVPLAGEAP